MSRRRQARVHIQPSFVGKVRKNVEPNLCRCIRDRISLQLGLHVPTLFPEEEAQREGKGTKDQSKACKKALHLIFLIQMKLNRPLLVDSLMGIHQKVVKDSTKRHQKKLSEALVRQNYEDTQKHREAINILEEFMEKVLSVLRATPAVVSSPQFRYGMIRSLFPQNGGIQGTARVQEEKVERHLDYMERLLVEADAPQPEPMHEPILEVMEGEDESPYTPETDKPEEANVQNQEFLEVEAFMDVDAFINELNERNQPFDEEKLPAEEPDSTEWFFDISQ